MEIENQAPHLRCIEGDFTRVCLTGEVFTGTAVHVNEEVVVIEDAAGRRIAIFLDDLTELAEVLGSASARLGLFLDAVEHGDSLAIGVASDRITYDNPGQFARFERRQTIAA